MSIYFSSSSSGICPSIGFREAAFMVSLTSLYIVLSEIPYFLASFLILPQLNSSITLAYLFIIVYELSQLKIRKFTYLLFVVKELNMKETIIATLINLLNITQKDFAQAIGASTGNVHDWVSGRTQPSKTSKKRSVQHSIFQKIG